MANGRRRSHQIRWVLALILAVGLLAGWPNLSSLASDQSLFTQQVVGPGAIDGAYRFSDVEGVPDVGVFRVTAPTCDSGSRTIYEVDAAGTPQAVATFTSVRPPSGCFIDSIVTIPQIGKGHTQSWPVNSMVVAFGKKLFLVADDPTAAILPIDFPTESACTSAAVVTGLAVDRWDQLFGGAVLLTCFDPLPLDVSTSGSVFEAWAITPAFQASLISRLRNVTITGKPEVAPPTFGSYANYLLVYPDNSQQLLAIKDQSTMASIPVSALPRNAGRGTVHALPYLLFSFASGGFFETIPARNEILKFPLSTFSFPGQVIIVTQNGTAVRVFVFPSASGYNSQSVHGKLSGNRTVADATSSPVGQVTIEVIQPAHGSDAGGVQGNIVIYIYSGPSFDPATIEESSLRFGLDGTQDSIQSNCNNSNVDRNGDGVPEKKCFADPAVAQCGNGVLCILTGVTENPVEFEGGD